jgi:hypothetical protein
MKYAYNREAVVQDEYSSFLVTVQIRLALNSCSPVERIPCVCYTIESILMSAANPAERVNRKGVKLHELYRI